MGSIRLERSSGLFRDKVIVLNLTAPDMVAKRAVKPQLEKERNGAIVDIASITDFRGYACGTRAFPSEV